MKRILAILFTTLACTKAATPVHDAGTERPGPDSAQAISDGPVALAVDFSVENCPAFDAEALTCTGKAPLSIRLVPLATTTVTQYFWDFGDATPNVGELAPAHTYATPGVYSVRVVATGLGGGVVQKLHAGFMIIEPNDVGALCDTNAQCNPGLTCLCSSSAPCNTGPAHGLCAASCESGICDVDQVCAGLRTASPPANKGSAWQAATCLRGCAKDADCAAGLSCRTLPPGKLGSAWIRGCFAATPGDVGEPCRDSEGALRDDLCASGMCADLGANGLCTATCGVASCPPGSDCVVFGDGRKLCLRPCTNIDCVQDPLLTCLVPNPGDLGYQPTGTNAATSYCAPTPCLNDAPCAPTGMCASITGPGHCVRRGN